MVPVLWPVVWTSDGGHGRGNQLRRPYLGILLFLLAPESGQGQRGSRASRDPLLLMQFKEMVDRLTCGIHFDGLEVLR